MIKNGNIRECWAVRMRGLECCKVDKTHRIMGNRKLVKCIYKVELDGAWGKGRPKRRWTKAKILSSTRTKVFGRMKGGTRMGLSEK